MMVVIEAPGSPLSISTSLCSARSSPKGLERRFAPRVGALLCSARWSVALFRYR